MPSKCHNEGMLVLTLELCGISPTTASAIEIYQNHLNRCNIWTDDERDERLPFSSLMWSKARGLAILRCLAFVRRGMSHQAA